MKSAKITAETFISSHVMSLQPQIASILERLGTKNLDMLHKLDNKEKQLKRMEDDPTFIPCSARIEFQFHMSNTAEESLEFIALRDETEAHVVTFRSTLKNQIIKATKIEIQAQKADIKQEYIKAINIVIEAFLVADDLQHISTHKAVS